MPGTRILDRNMYSYFCTRKFYKVGFKRWRKYIQWVSKAHYKFRIFNYFLMDVSYNVILFDSPLYKQQRPIL